MNDYGPRRMVDIDIAQPLPVLQESPGSAGAFAIVWRDRLPLCTLDIQNGEMPLSCDAVLQSILQRAVLQSVIDQVALNIASTYLFYQYNLFELDQVRSDQVRHQHASKPVLKVR